MKYNVFAYWSMRGEYATFPEAVELFLKEVRARIRSLQPCGFQDGYYIFAVMKHGAGTLSTSLSITEVMQICEEFNVIDDEGDVRKNLSIEVSIAEHLFFKNELPIHALARELGILDPL